MGCFFAKAKIGQSPSASAGRGNVSIGRLRTTTGAVAVATAIMGTTTAKADVLAAASTGNDYTGLCDSSFGCSGSPSGWTVSNAFTLDKGATISEIRFYS